MAVSFAAILEKVRQGVTFIEGLSPLLAELPGGLGPLAQEVVDAAATVTAIATNVQQRVADGKLVLQTNDEAELQGLIARLEAENAKLDAYIDTH